VREAGRAPAPGHRRPLGRYELERAVEKALDDSGREVPAVVTAIAALAPRLRAVLTTNLDRLLEWTFGVT
jgi:hypothetical protein